MTKKEEAERIRRAAEQIKAIIREKCRYLLEYDHLFPKSPWPYAEAEEFLRTRTTYGAPGFDGHSPVLRSRSIYIADIYDISAFALHLGRLNWWLDRAMEVKPGPVRDAMIKKCDHEVRKRYYE